MELGASWLLLAPFRLLFVLGGGIQTAFQLAIIVSGNLSFLNYLTILPFVWCFDDRRENGRMEELTGSGLFGLVLGSLLRRGHESLDPAGYRFTPGRRSDPRLLPYPFWDPSAAQQRARDEGRTFLGSPRRRNLEPCFALSDTLEVLARHSLPSKTTASCPPPRALSWLFPEAARSAATAAAAAASSAPPPALRSGVSWFVVGLVGCLSAPVVKNMASKKQSMNRAFEPLRIVNTYGAFGSVSKVRAARVGTAPGRGERVRRPAASRTDGSSLCLSFLFSPPSTG